MAARSLIMVAKCLQNLANLVEFGGKEPYMEVVNPFILKNKERMVVFLDQLSVSNSLQQDSVLLANAASYPRVTILSKTVAKTSEFALL